MTDVEEKGEEHGVWNAKKWKQEMRRKRKNEKNEVLRFVAREKRRPGLQKQSQCLAEAQLAGEQKKGTAEKQIIDPLLQAISSSFSSLGEADEK